MKLSAPERLQRVLDYTKLSINGLAEKIGLKRSQQLYDIRDGKIKNISLSLAVKINAAYPLIDLNWLTGNGDVMIKLPRLEAKPITVMPDPDEFKDNDHKFAYSDEGVIAMRVKVVPARAQLGYLRGFADPEWFESFDEEIIPVTKEARGTYLGFETIGRSMVNLTTDWWADKSIFPNRIAIGRELNRDKWRDKLHIHSNDAWVIVHKREGIILKEIIHHDTSKGNIIVHSWNPDKEQYPDETINLEDVAQLFNVVQVVDKRR